MNRKISKQMVWLTSTRAHLLLVAIQLSEFDQSSLLIPKFVRIYS
jgi:hypothetical protein